MSKQVRLSEFKWYICNYCRFSSSLTFVVIMHKRHLEKRDVITESLL